MLHSWHEPQEVPALYWGGWFILTIGGRKMKISEYEAGEIMSALRLL
jgi:hypothetical protein